MRPILRPLVALVAAAILLAPAVAGAYTIVLKDGSQIISKAKYRVDGARALFTLPSGAEATLALDQIDVQRTEAANKADYGTGVSLGTGTTTAIPQTQKREVKPSLKDYIRDREGQLRELPTAKRETKGTDVAAGKTLAGFDDLFEMTRTPATDLDLVSALRTVYHGEGVTQMDVYGGTQRSRLLVEVITNSEAALFRSLQVTSKAILEVSKTYPKLAAIELVAVTENRVHAGQFVITPELAAELDGNPQEVAAFFVKNVQF